MDNKNIFSTLIEADNPNLGFEIDTGQLFNPVAIPNKEESIVAILGNSDFQLYSDEIAKLVSMNPEVGMSADDKKVLAQTQQLNHRNKQMAYYGVTPDEYFDTRFIPGEQAVKAPIRSFLNLNPEFSPVRNTLDLLMRPMYMVTGGLNALVDDNTSTKFLGSAMNGLMGTEDVSGKQLIASATNSVYDELGLVAGITGFALEVAMDPFTRLNPIVSTIDKTAKIVKKSSLADPLVKNLGGMFNVDGSSANKVQKNANMSKEATNQYVAKMTQNNKKAYDLYQSQIKNVANDVDDTLIKEYYGAEGTLDMLLTDVIQDNNVLKINTSEVNKLFSNGAGSVDIYTTMDFYDFKEEITKHAYKDALKMVESKTVGRDGSKIYTLIKNRSIDPFRDDIKMEFATKSIKESEIYSKLSPEIKKVMEDTATLYKKNMDAFINNFKSLSGTGFELNDFYAADFRENYLPIKHYDIKDPLNKNKKIRSSTAVERGYRGHTLGQTKFGKHTQIADSKLDSITRNKEILKRLERNEESYSSKINKINLILDDFINNNPNIDLNQNQEESIAKVIGLVENLADDAVKSKKINFLGDIIIKNQDTVLEGEDFIPLENSIKDTLKTFNSDVKKTNAFVKLLSTDANGVSNINLKKVLNVKAINTLQDIKLNPKDIKTIIKNVNQKASLDVLDVTKGNIDSLENIIFNNSTLNDFFTQQQTELKSMTNEFLGDILEQDYYRNNPLDDINAKAKVRNDGNESFRVSLDRFSKSIDSLKPVMKDIRKRVLSEFPEVKPKSMKATEWERILLDKKNIIKAFNEFDESLKTVKKTKSGLSGMVNKTKTEPLDELKNIIDKGIANSKKGIDFDDPFPNLDLDIDAMKNVSGFLTDKVDNIYNIIMDIETKSGTKKFEKLLNTPMNNIINQSNSGSLKKLTSNVIKQLNKQDKNYLNYFKEKEINNVLISDKLRTLTSDIEIKEELATNFNKILDNISYEGNLRDRKLIQEKLGMLKNKKVLLNDMNDNILDSKLLIEPFSLLGAKIEQIPQQAGAVTAIKEILDLVKDGSVNLIPAKGVSKRAKVSLVDLFNGIGGVKTGVGKSLVESLTTIDKKINIDNIFDYALDVDRDLASMLQRSVNPVPVSNFINAYDTAMSYFKGTALLNVSYHMSNFIGNMVNAYVGGMMPTTMLKYSMQGKKMLSKYNNIIDDIMFNPNYIPNKQDWDVLDKVAPFMGSGLTTHKAGSAGGKLFNDYFNIDDKDNIIKRIQKANFDLSANMENGQRFGTYLYALENNDKIPRWLKKDKKNIKEKLNFITPEQYAKTGIGNNTLPTNFGRNLAHDDAIKFTESILFNYSDLTNFEENVIKRVMPFYTFAKKNAVLTAKVLANDPTKITNTVKLYNTAMTRFMDKTGTSEEQIPDYFVETGIVPLAMLSNQDFVGGIKLSNPALSGLETLTSPMGAAVNLLSPAFKAPLELMNNTSFYSGEELYDSDEGKPLLNYMSNIFTMSGANFINNIAESTRALRTTFGTGLPSLMEFNENITKDNILPSIFKTTSKTSNQYYKTNTELAKIAFLMNKFDLDSELNPDSFMNMQALSGLNPDNKKQIAKFLINNMT